MPHFSSGSFLLVFSLEFCMNYIEDKFYHLTHVCKWPSFDYFNNIRRRVQITKPSLSNFFHLPVTFAVLVPNIAISTLLSYAIVITF
jgi:hypothetical protein